MVAAMWWWGRIPFYKNHLAGLIPDSSLSPIYGFFYMSIACLILRTVLPLAIIRFRFGRPARDFGYRLGGTFRMWWIYAALGLGVGRGRVAVARPHAGHVARHGSRRLPRSAEQYVIS